MNELIRELALKADGVFIHKLMTGVKQYTFLERDLEKFAELIVRECASIADKAEPYKANELIKKHFGVE